jgi:hypothetical protein
MTDASQDAKFVGCVNLDREPVFPKPLAYCRKGSTANGAWPALWFRACRLCGLGGQSSPCPVVPLPYDELGFKSSRAARHHAGPFSVVC